MTTETITIHGHTYARMYCVCGYEYKARDNDTVDDYLYEIEYHRAVHPRGWDIAGADYYLELNPGWEKMERLRG